MLSLTSNAQSQLRPRGDVNCDWEVNIADISALVDNILNETPYHEFYTYALDLNGDKEINIADINGSPGSVHLSGRPCKNAPEHASFHLPRKNGALLQTAFPHLQQVLRAHRTCCAYPRQNTPA